MKKMILLLLLILPSTTFSQTDSIGVYYKVDTTLFKIRPINTTGTKTNTIGSALTMGIASSSMTAKFKGAHSINQTDGGGFVFFFCDNINPSLATTYFSFMGGSSPSNFSLVKFKSTKKNRELNWGKINIYSGTDIGVKDGDLIPYTYEEVEHNVFVVTPSFELTSGEYGFIVDAPNGAGLFMPVFDFRVQ